MGGAGDGTDTAMPRQFHDVCGFGEDFRRHRFWPEADFFRIRAAAVFLHTKLKNKALGLPGRAYSKGGSEGFPDLKLPAIADSKLPIWPRRKFESLKLRAEGLNTGGKPSELRD